MILQELKKICTPMRIVLLIVISILVYRSFLSPIVKRFEVGDGVDAFQEKLCISREWMMEYGATIESEEFTDIENRYHEIIAEIEKSMVQKKAFVECDVKNYKEFLEYQTNVLNGKEGFDYHKYKEMDETLFADTPYSSIYLQEYEKMMMDYEMASEGCYNVLPDEVIIYSTDLLRYMSLWCLIVVLMVASPVMVNDVASNMNRDQYSSKIGRKIYKIQYFCTIFSVLLVEVVVIAFGMAVWGTTNAMDFGKVGLASFMYHIKPTLHITYAEVFGLFMVIMGLMGIGVGSMAFCLSSCSNNMITMLMKVTPLAVVAGAYILSLENVFYENNRLYGFVHISGIEIISAIIIFVAGIIFNIVRYKRIGARH